MEFGYKLYMSETKIYNYICLLFIFPYEQSQFYNAKIKNSISCNNNSSSSL